jgi:hypothetical protein
MAVGTNVNKKAPKTLIYKRIEIDDPDNKLQAGVNLQTLLTNAVAKIRSPILRSEKINDESELRRVVGHFVIDRKMFCGQVMMYEKGMDIAFLVQDPDTDVIEIETQNITDPDESKDGKKREVLQGALFFVVHENHMAIIQSQSVGYKALELHINWMLKECAEVLDSSISVVLNNEPQEKALKAISDGEFKSVQMGSPVRYEGFNEEDRKDITIQDTASIKTHHFADGIDIIKSMFKDSWSDKLDLPDGMDASNLRVTVEVKYQRASSTESRKWLDDLARASRHLDPEDTVIKTKNGETITGDELRLKDKRSVLTHNGVIDRASAYNELILWLKELFSKNKIG